MPVITQRNLILIFVTLILLLIAPIMQGKELTFVDLPYRYQFWQTGERILDLEIKNESNYLIEGLEFQLVILDDLGDPVSSLTSSHVDLNLAPQEWYQFFVEQIPKEGRHVELKYTKISLGDGTILGEGDLYPKIKKSHGQYEIELETINNKELADQRKYNFTTVNSARASSIEKYIKSLSYNQQQQYSTVATLGEITKLFNGQGIILLVKATNVSEEPAKKYWESQVEPVFTLVDEQYNQYNQYSRLYLPQLMENLALKAPQHPGVTLTMVYIFDQFNDHTPQELTVYIDGENTLKP